MKTEKLCIIIKPGFEKKEKEIVARLSKYGKITKRQVMLLNDAILADHYAEHVGKEFYENLCQYMKSGPVVVFQLEGGEGCVKQVRKETGATRNPDFGIGDTTRNVIHASDSPEAGIIECNRMFRDAKKYGVKILSSEKERTC